MADSLSRYRERLIEGGMSAEDADRLIAVTKRQGELADRLICAKCGGTLSRTRDERQGGPTELKNPVWYNYKCGTCRDFFDRAEEAS